MTFARNVLLVCVMLDVITGWDRRQESHAPAASSAGSKSAARETPVGSLDAVFAEIVRTDRQTEGRWLGGAPTPPADFVARVRERAEFRTIDLDGDGTPEQIICLNYAPGQKPTNQPYYVAQKAGNEWRLIGTLEGEPQPTTNSPRDRLEPLDVWWYIGGGEYTTTRYEFKNGRYVAGESKRWQPTEGR